MSKVCFDWYHQDSSAEKKNSLLNNLSTQLVYVTNITFISSLFSRSCPSVLGNTLLEICDVICVTKAMKAKSIRYYKEDEIYNYSVYDEYNEIIMLNALNA